MLLRCSLALTGLPPTTSLRDRVKCALGFVAAVRSLPIGAGSAFEGPVVTSAACQVPSTGQLGQLVGNDTCGAL